MISPFWEQRVGRWIGTDDDDDDDCGWWQIRVLAGKVEFFCQE